MITAFTIDRMRWWNFNAVILPTKTIISCYYEVSEYQNVDAFHIHLAVQL